MVRRIGFNSSSDAGRPGLRADKTGTAGRIENPPEIRRNWRRIAIQCLWVDLWIIADFEIGRGIFHAVIDETTSPSSDQLFLFSAVALCGVISACRLIRLLRGEPLTAAGA